MDLRQDVKAEARFGGGCADMISVMHMHFHWWAIAQGMLEQLGDYNPYIKHYTYYILHNL